MQFFWELLGDIRTGRPNLGEKVDIKFTADLTTGYYLSPSVYSLSGMTAEDTLREYIADLMPEESYRRSSSPRKSPSSYGSTYRARLRRWA